MGLEPSMTTEDIRRLLRLRSKRYRTVFLGTVCFVILWRLLTPPEHTASATFRFAMPAKEESDRLRSFLENNKSVFGKEGGVQAVFESRVLLREVAEQTGLVLSEKKSLLSRTFVSIFDGIRAELGLSIPDRSGWKFSDVRLSESHSSEFVLKRIDSDRFSVYDGKKKFLGEGKIGEPFSTPDGSFTVTSGGNIRSGGFCRILAPRWINVVKDLKSRLKIKVGKTDKNIFTLSFSHRSSEVAAQFLNLLTDEYRKTLQQDNEETASAQMAYLEKRRKELFTEYEKSLDLHTAFLQKDLQETGLFGVYGGREVLLKSSEEYRSRIYEIDLKLSRLRKKIPDTSSRYSPVCRILTKERIEGKGANPDTTEKLCIEYGKEKDRIDMEIEQLARLERGVFAQDFEISCLGEVLSDSVGRDMMQKAAKIALDLQDFDNYGSKERERMIHALDVQKRFLSNHLHRLQETKRLQTRLIEEKIDALQETSVRLLQEEKDLLRARLAALSSEMASIPEKRKREDLLKIERDVGLGMLEGLAQLTESKNIQHRLFYVESKAIDPAVAPLLPDRRWLPFQALFAAVLVCFGLLLRDCMKRMRKGVFVTPSLAETLGIAFCGFLSPRFSGRAETSSGEEKEVLRKAAVCIGSQKSPRCVAAIFSPSQSFSKAIAEILVVQGKRVLEIECTPAIASSRGESGLYEYLAEGTPVSLRSGNGLDTISAGRYRSDYPDLLFRKEFQELIQEYSTNYDVILLCSGEHPKDVQSNALFALSDLIVVHAEEVLYRELPSGKPAAVLLT